MFCEKGALKNFAINSQENTCARVSFFNKVAGLRPATLLKKRLRHRCFPVTFTKFLRTTFLIEHLRATASSKNAYFHCDPSIKKCRCIRIGKNKIRIKNSEKMAIGIYLFKVNNGNVKKKCEACSKLTIKTPERRQ